MSEDNYHNKYEIPEAFLNYSTNSNFTNCIDCDRFLLEGDIEYFIEKAMKAYQGYKAIDVVFEYAICMECAEKVRKKMSADSMKSIQNYFMDNVDLNDRLSLVNTHNDKPAEWIEKCMIKGTGKDQLEEYQIYAHCRGKQLITTQMPYMISGPALDDIANLLSNQTLDELDNFMNDNFGPPPELEESLPKRRVVLV